MSGADGNRNIPGRFPLKATDVREISTIRLVVRKKSKTSIQVDNRAIINPIFKKYGNTWVEATGAIGVTYDEGFQYAELNNSTDCDLELLVRIV